MERVARRVLVVPMQPAGGVAAFKLEKGEGQLVKARGGRLTSALASPRDESFLGFVFSPPTASNLPSRLQKMEN